MTVGSFSLESVLVGPPSALVFVLVFGFILGFETELGSLGGSKGLGLV